MQAEILVLIDENENVVATAGDAAALAELYENEVGDSADIARRVVKLTITITPPTVTEVFAVVPETEGEPMVSVN